MNARASIAWDAVPAQDGPDWLTPELLAETLRVWQPYYDAPLTERDALAIVANVAGLLDALEEAA